ncbi:hypothetical protein TNIN_470941 [Trichonephila inaurata madagascariensis]|uniref:Uncharacterized protein n=1 Tax=Trichonephila inaurata madagascariensis TaxID=2747483 RepID=A0A8X6XY22_9ARAC|nr:hypothetical protein TNIN_470941 [Trichonephila inaurata madagascariensis]
MGNHEESCSLTTNTRMDVLSNRENSLKYWIQFLGEQETVIQEFCYVGIGMLVYIALGDRHVDLHAWYNRGVTSRQLPRNLTAASASMLSRQNVFRRLGEKGSYNRKPVVCDDPFMQSHKKKTKKKLFFRREQDKARKCAMSSSVTNCDSTYKVVLPEFSSKRNMGNTHPANIREVNHFNGTGIFL